MECTGTEESGMPEWLAIFGVIAGCLSGISAVIATIISAYGTLRDPKKVKGAETGYKARQQQSLAKISLSIVTIISAIILTSYSVYAITEWNRYSDIISKANSI